MQTNLQKAGVRHHLLGIYHIYQRLFDGHIANATHVEPIYVFPPCTYKKQTRYPCEWPCTQYVFSGFFFFLQFSGTSKALFSLFLLSCQHKKGSRENKTERLTLPGRTVPLSFCLSRPYVEKDKPSRKYTLASSSTSSRMSGILVLL